MNYIFLIINATCLVCIHKQESWYQGKKEKKIYPCGGQVVFGWGTSIVSWIECVVPIFTNLFEMKSFIKMAFSPPPTCSISYRHLYWNIPGAPWQGRTRRFPFQTGLSCPSNHQGSLRKYIPSVEAWGERESGWKWAEAGVRKRCLRLPVACSLGGSVAGGPSPQIHVSLPRSWNN